MSSILLYGSHSVRARYSFNSVIVGITNESVTMLFEALSGICSLVVDVYQACLEKSKSRKQKLKELARFEEIEPYLEDVLSFCTIEAGARNVPDRQAKMEELTKEIRAHKSWICSNLKREKSNDHNEYAIFDLVLQFLELVMTFLDQRHQAEKEYLCAFIEEIVIRANNARTIENEKILVTESQKLLQSCLELLRNTKRLIFAQVTVSASLKPRLHVVNCLLQTALPNYLKICREKIKRCDNETIFKQNTCFMQLCSILSEFKNVVLSIRSNNKSTIEALDPLPALSPNQCPSSANDLLAMLKNLEFKVGQNQRKSNLKALVSNLVNSFNMDSEQRADFKAAVRDSILETQNHDAQAKVVSGIYTAEKKNDLIELTKDMLKALRNTSKVLASKS